MENSDFKNLCVIVMYCFKLKRVFSETNTEPFYDQNIIYYARKISYLGRF